MEIIRLILTVRLLILVLRKTLFFFFSFNKCFCPRVRGFIWKFFRGGFL